MSDDNKVEWLLCEVVDECENTNQVIYAGLTLINAVLGTIKKEDTDEAYEFVERMKVYVINEVKKV